MIGVVSLDGAPAQDVAGLPLPLRTLLLVQSEGAEWLGVMGASYRLSSVQAKLSKTPPDKPTAPSASKCCARRVRSFFPHSHSCSCLHLRVRRRSLQACS